MKRFLIIFFVLVFALLIFPKLQTVSAGCDNAYNQIVGKYSSLGEDFWKCSGQYNPYLTDQCLNDGIGCRDMSQKECTDQIFNTITTDRTKWEEPTAAEIAGTLYDGTFASCYQSWLNKDILTWQNIYRDNLTEFINSNYRKYASSTKVSVAKDLNGILDCGFAGDPDPNKRKCCTNTINDLDVDSINNARIDEQSSCLAGLVWPQGGCVLSQETISAPIKSYIVNELNVRLGEAESALQDNPTPQCVVGVAFGEGSSCICQRSTGAQICGDSNQYVNLPSVQEYRLLLNRMESKFSSLVGFEKGVGFAGVKKNCADPNVNDLDCKRLAELENDKDVQKYNASYSQCSNSCMDLNDDVSAEKRIYTALGCVIASPQGLIDKVFEFGIGLAGVVALGCIIYAAFLLQTSAGDPERVKSAQELMTSCITGLIMIIFSVLILQIIGVKVLKIPSFGSNTSTASKLVPTQPIATNTPIPQNQPITTPTTLNPIDTTEVPPRNNALGLHDCDDHIQPNEVYLFDDDNFGGNCVRLVVGEKVNLKEITNRQTSPTLGGNWWHRCLSSFNDCVSSVMVGSKVNAKIFKDVKVDGNIISGGGCGFTAVDNMIKIFDVKSDTCTGVTTTFTDDVSFVEVVRK